MSLQPVSSKSVDPLANVPVCRALGLAEGGAGEEEEQEERHAGLDFGQEEGRGGLVFGPYWPCFSRWGLCTFSQQTMFTRQGGKVVAQRD